MKLGLVTHYMPPHHGGIERIAFDHATAAANAGFEVRWVASREPSSTSRKETMAWGEARRVPCLNFFETSLGVPYPLWSGAGRREIRELVDWSDVIHVHDVLYQGTSLALAAAQRARRPALLTQHIGLVPYRSFVLNAAQRMAYRTIGRRNGRRATALAYYNESARDWLRQVCGITPPSVFLPNGVDTDLFRPVEGAAEMRSLRERFGLPQDRMVVLFVGRLVSKKGADVVVGAARPAYHVLLVGERGNVEIGNRPGVELRAFVERNELADLMRACDVFALPSRGEGFPLAAQEAMASGLAVILSNDPSYRAQVDPGAAVFIEPDPISLAERLRHLERAPAERLELGGRARENALRMWSLETCRQAVVDVYRQLQATGTLRA